MKKEHLMQEFENLKIEKADKVCGGEVSGDGMTEVVVHYDCVGSDGKVTQDTSVYYYFDAAQDATYVAPTYPELKFKP